MCVCVYTCVCVYVCLHMLVEVATCSHQTVFSLVSFHQISLQSDVVKISGLLLGDGTSPQPNQGYQVCMCGSGKLFLASSSGCSSYNICN